MTDSPPAAGMSPAAGAFTYSGRSLSLPGSGDTHSVERERLIARARDTDAARQLQRCFPRWLKLNAFEHLSWPALVRLTANQPVDPNEPDAWQSRDAHAKAVLRRHGYTHLNVKRLTLAALNSLIERQGQADRDAGVDWSTITNPAGRLDERLRRAHANLPLDLTDPAVYVHRDDQRRAVAGRLGVPGGQADDLSRWTLTHPDQFDAGDLRCWRIGSDSWLALADEQLEPVGIVQRPVGLFVMPALQNDGWQLLPVLSLDMIRLVTRLGGRLDRSLCAATLAADAVGALLERVSVQTLHAGPKECLDCAGQLAQELSRELGHHVSPGIPVDKRERWGRLLVSRQGYRGADGTIVAELRLRAVTFPVRGFGRRLLDAQRIPAAGKLFGERDYQQPSAVMDLGEAIQAAVQRGLPLLLSTEAAGHLKDSVRVGRMKGRPGMVTITSSDGVSASTRRLAAEQAVATLRKLKREGPRVTLDAGARQLIRMTLARPLEDDPVLLGRQQQIAALKVVGSGVDASQTGAGKTITSARAIAHRATTQPRFRGLLIAEGRLLGQWREELTRGAPGRGLPPLAPNFEILMLDERRQVARQIRAFDRELADRPGLVLAANGILDRYPADLQAIQWHLLVADEALRYANPATEAHQALAQVRFGAVADCWLLTATPRGKSSEHLDILVGLAVGDRAMITERLNTREAGDLMDELNAHRLRVNYGPHLVRVTRKDMQAWMPDLRPAKPLALDPDVALGELLDAIRAGGREAYRRLLEALRELKRLEHGTPLFRQALAELSRAQGVVLGNVGVYLDASVDPETLTHSKAALAQALVRQGLVHHAMRGCGDGLPLLRGVVAQTLAGIAGEEQVLVFAERVWCLRQLARTLCDRHHVEARVADGQVDTAQFEQLKAGFCAGEFPVLCLSRFGHEGHNLQSASV
ncbi:MAG: SNF2-related protein, partial [Solirubrobacteraceae bacterium]